MLQIVYTQLPGMPEEKPKKRVPLYKDEAAIARGVRELTLEMNAKIRARKANNS